MKPINLTLQSSQHLYLVLILASLLFGGMCYFMPLPVFWRFLMIVFVGLATTYSCLRYALLAHPSSVVAIQVNSKNQLLLVRKDGQQLAVQVLENTVVTSGLTLLSCWVEEASLWQKIFTLHVIILPDAVDVEHYRQLRVWLRWAKDRLPQTAALDSADDKKA